MQSLLIIRSVLCPPDVVLQRGKDTKFSLFLSCLRCNGHASELERVLLQIVPHPPGQRELVHVGCSLVNPQPAEVLETGDVVFAAQRPDEFQVYCSCCHLFLQGR